MFGGDNKTLSKTKEKVTYDKFIWKTNETADTERALGHLFGELNKYDTSENNILKKFCTINVSNGAEVTVLSDTTLYHGRTDGAIIPILEDAINHRLHLRVAIELKKPETVLTPSSNHQMLFEAVGYSSFSIHPVLMVLTDLIDNFKIFVLHKENVTNAPPSAISLFTCFKADTLIKLDGQKAMELIVAWLNNICSDEQSISLKNKRIPFVNAAEHLRAEHLRRNSRISTSTPEKKTSNFDEVYDRFGHQEDSAIFYDDDESQLNEFNFN
jgi:hypothetical protein